MSSSNGFPDRRSSGKAPEKSNFAQTCNRLSQFIKEKGSLGDLRLEFAGKLELKGIPKTPQITAVATRNMFPKMEEIDDDTSTKQELMDLFPQHAGIGCPSTIQLHPTDIASSSKSAAAEPEPEPEPKTAQLTIFYGGNMFVFDNFPADKVGELILFGSSKENCPSSSGFLSPPPAENVKPTYAPLVAASPGPSSDIPIATRSSLHRFFDKRKDRVASKAPYQVQGGPSASSSSKNKESIDLNL